MKNKLFKTLLVLLIIPVLFFTGCKKEKLLPAIDLSTYLNNEISVKFYQMESASTQELSFIAAPELDKDKLGKYVSFELNTNSVWMYKMYIETISFYVYTTQSSITEMIVNVSITNVADEETLKTITSEEPTTDTAKEQCAFIPEANKATKCTFNIGKAIAKPTGSIITIDILNSLELFDDENEETSFKWVIYGLEITGESRAYSKS